MFKFLSWIGLVSLLLGVAVFLAVSKGARDVVIFTGKTVFSGDSVSPSPLEPSQPNNPDLSIIEATLHDFMGRLNQQRFEDAYYYAYFQPSSRGNIRSFENFWKRYQPNSIIYSDPR